MRVFADSFYFFAMLNQKDQSHARAAQWTETFTGQLVTTEWVLLELADGLASSPGRASFFRTRQRLLADPQHRLIPLSMSLHEDGLQLFEARPDKQWTLTDCISFVVMRLEGLVEALTGDHHFEQAGFVALLK